jgi:hypothetical protein
MAVTTIMPRLQVAPAGKGASDFQVINLPNQLCLITLFNTSPNEGEGPSVHKEP